MENDSHWKTSKYNCPDFLKNYICKHVVDMSTRLKYCKTPAAAKTVPVGKSENVVDQRKLNELCWCSN